MRDCHGLTVSDRRKVAAKVRAVALEEARHSRRMVEPNPACRIQAGAQDWRPEDIAFNRACRAFEIKQWA